MTDRQRQADERVNTALIAENIPQLAQFRFACPSCKKRLRVGIKIESGVGKATFVVWCHGIQCDGCRGDGETVMDANKDLLSNYEKRQSTRR